MKKSLLPLVFLILVSCQSEKKTLEKQEYLRWVGDIKQNDQIDERDFKVCNGDENSKQYFNLGGGPIYNGEKSRILQTYKDNFQTIANKDLASSEYDLW
ncbi:hypothetical protein [uncultured Planktosalinus sp.]|uniref:hypothetical protein n=1 Tax=uncultured Planktosalinus sp. TaxID=1810935 RepID=UPI0030DC1C31